MTLIKIKNGLANFTGGVKNQIRKYYGGKKNGKRNFKYAAKVIKRIAFAKK